MIFDDHDVHDDWNISSWVEEMRAKPWWDARITGAFMSYWIYQHLGNLSPPELAEETIVPRCRGTTTRARVCAESRTSGTASRAACRWAYYRDFGNSRLLVDRLACGARARRRPTGDGRRGGVGLDRRALARRLRPLVIASTLPVFMPHGIHHLEAWNEAICAGAGVGWRSDSGSDSDVPSTSSTGRPFSARFGRLVAHLLWLWSASIAEPPRSITILSAAMSTRRTSRTSTLGGSRSRARQVVCSPFRHPLPTARAACLQSGRVESGGDDLWPPGSPRRGRAGRQVLQVF